ncbi:hypothetical protein V8E53_014636 [Lactarius tabidus]
MSSPLLPSFNPNAKYPWTDHTKGVIPEPPSPSKYGGRGVPSTHVACPQNPPSPPGSQSPTPLVSPIPQQYAPQQMVTTRSTSSASSISSSSSTSSSKPVFTLYRPDGRGTPELEDVLLKKKSTWSKK